MQLLLAQLESLPLVLWESFAQEPGIASRHHLGQSSRRQEIVIGFTRVTKAGKDQRRLEVGATRNSNEK